MLKSDRAALTNTSTMALNLQPLTYQLCSFSICTSPAPSRSAFIPSFQTSPHLQIWWQQCNLKVSVSWPWDMQDNFSERCRYWSSPKKGLGEGWKFHVRNCISHRGSHSYEGGLRWELIALFSCRCSEILTVFYVPQKVQGYWQSPGTLICWRLTNQSHALIYHKNTFLFHLWEQKGLFTKLQSGERCGPDHQPFTHTDELLLTQVVPLKLLM